MAISVKKQALAQSMNPFVTIQLTSGAFPRFLKLKSTDASGEHFFHVTSDKSAAHKMPLPTANALLRKIKRDWPLARIAHHVS
ncbi:hypothetical protein DX885_000845 [Vibrio mimicus]